MQVHQISIGVDEAGRGCLAGPVYAGAVIFNRRERSTEIRDSKTLSEIRRENVYEYILKRHRVGIGFATVEEITQFNILGAALLAMKRAVEELKLRDDEKESAHVYVDGDQPIRNFRLAQTAVVSGDERMKVIAAASIVAKVNRDREVRKLAELFPQYGLASHKGYATEEHRLAIKKHGPSVIHRPTFAGVREFV